MTTLLEGLPHPYHEADLFKAEKRRAAVVREVRDSWFYKEPLIISPQLATELRDIVANPASFSPMEEGALKFCGGFHADYALEWFDGDVERTTMICFGCREAKSVGRDRFEHVEMTAEADKRLASLLKGVRKNRPVPK